ncbi:hypothetical protein ACEPAF_7552 [Sanghuangporus sanghuang]
MLHITQVTPESITYLVLGGFVVFFSLISLPLKERLFFGEVVLGTAFGVIIGPHCAGIFNPRSWGSTPETVNRITLEFMRVVLATGLFAIGAELPKAYLARHARSLIAMIVPTMAFGWFVVAGVIKGLFPALDFVSSLVIAACLTPTDPVLSATIIGGKFATRHVPAHLRHLLSAESAANDGLAYPFLSISIYLAIESNTSVAFGKFFLIGCLYQVILGTVLGAVLGIVFSRLMIYAQRNDLIDRESIVVQYLALAIFTIGIVNSLGSDDLLAAFAAGTAISWDGHFRTRTENEVFSTVIDLVLNCASFIYIGAWIPFGSFNDMILGMQPWRLVVLFIATLALRRIPSILLLYKFVPDIHNWREALFCGHFGPMGVGAIFISTLAISELPIPRNPPGNQNELLAASLHPIVSFIVLGSVIIHGLSISMFWFGKKTVQRTVSLTTTLSRTWTSRGQAGPEWLMSVNRASRTENSSRDDCVRTPRTVADVERFGTSTAELEKTVSGEEIRTPEAALVRAQQPLSRATSVNIVIEREDIVIRDRAREVTGDKHGVRVPAGVEFAALHDAKEADERRVA